MRKYINVRFDGEELNVDVVGGPEDLRIGTAACGWLDEADLDDLNTPARLMTRQLLGEENESVVEQLEEAFEEILTRREVKVNVNYV